MVGVNRTGWYVQSGAGKLGEESRWRRGPHIPLHRGHPLLAPQVGGTGPLQSRLLGQGEKCLRCWWQGRGVHSVHCPLHGSARRVPAQPHSAESEAQRRPAQRTGSHSQLVAGPGPALGPLSPLSRDLRDLTVRTVSSPQGAVRPPSPTPSPRPAWPTLSRPPAARAT